MKAILSFNGKEYEADLMAPLDISIPLKEGMETVNCFWAPPLECSPVKAGDFIGDTTQGGPVNFKNVKLNPHGNGTHTECVGHIATEPYFLNDCLKQFMFPAMVISVIPLKEENGDRVIKRDLLEEIFPQSTLAPALILRTLPNDDLKMRTNYSGSNPTYLEATAISYLVERGVEHFLLDLPSVDREEDDGMLLSHKAFWQYPGDSIRKNCTISELIYVPDSIKDGLYLLNLQITSLELDASPSKPILYALKSVSI